MRTSLPLLALLCIVSIGLSQQEVTLTATKDCGIYEIADGSLSSGTGASLFVGKIGPNGQEKLRRALVKFNLSDLPENAKIVSAQVVVDVKKVNNSTARVTKLHRVTSEWGEGTSDGGATGQGAAATTGDATWKHRFFNTVDWGTLGGDFVANASSTVNIAGTGAYSFDSTSLLIGDVQGWLSDTSTNFGWMIVGDEVSSQSVKVISSREDVTAANRPKLILKYSIVNRVGNNPVQPIEFALHQNYPNPFNPATTIRYSIPVSGHVSLKVFDVLGNEIATLVNSVKSAGTFRQEWNASGVPSGLYFYRLQAGNLVSTKKMLLVK